MAGDMDAAPHRKQAERSFETRNALLDATVEALLKEGYEGCSLARLAQYADLTTGSVQHHFRTKAELMVAVIEERIFDIPDDLFEVDPEHLKMPVRDRCKLVVERQWVFYGRPRYIVFWSILLGISTDAEVAERIATWENKAIAKHVQAIREFFADYPLSMEKAEAIRQFLNAQMRGLALLTVVKAEQVNLDEQLDMLINMLEMQITSLSSSS